MIEMNFRKGLAGAALATGLAIAVLAGCSNVNSAPPPAPTPTLESAIQATATPSKKTEQSIKILWEDNQSKLSYTDGIVSWKTGIAEGIEETIFSMTNGQLLKTPNNFLIEGYVINDRYGTVIAYGSVEDTSFNKISLRDKNTGIETSSYWLRGNIIRDMVVIHDGDASNGAVDYLVIGGFSKNSDLVFPTQDKLNRAVRSVPIIEVFKLDANGITPVSYNPVALVDGIVTDIGITGGNGKVSLQVGIRSSDAYGNRTEGITTLSLDKVLSAKMYEPLIGN